MLEKSKSQSISQQVALTGVGASRQGSLPGVSRYVLAVEAFQGALEDAGIDKNAIDGMVAWNSGYGGIDPDRFAKLCGLDVNATAALKYGSGGFSVQQAAMMIASGLCETVAVVYAQNAEAPLDKLSGDVMYDAGQALVNPATAAAMGWRQHADRYGPYSEEALGLVAIAARNHARLNPDAVFRDELTMEQYLDDPMLIEPFRSLDICKMTAGGYALILSAADRAKDGPHPRILLHAIGRHPSPDPVGDRNHLLLPGMRRTAEQVYEAAGCGPEDIDLLGISDGHTAVVLMTLEQYGFCEFGASEEFVRAGNIELGGELPINPDGGQLSAAYSVGFLHQVEIVRQLRGECGDRQVEGAEVAQYTTTGSFRQEYLSNIYVRG